MRKTLDFILNGSEVKRFHTLTTHQLETVGHHSHGVACLTLMLNPDASRELIIAALFHDLAEQHTGDVDARTHGSCRAIGEHDEQHAGRDGGEERRGVQPASPGGPQVDGSDRRTAHEGHPTRRARRAVRDSRRPDRPWPRPTVHPRE